MLTLAIETATSVCSVALVKDGKVLAEYSVDSGMTHSEGLLPQIDQMMQRVKIAKNDIELIAVSMGPGSFTGLRIGLATAEAMAYSWQCCLHGVDTLEALAYNLPLEGFILSPVLDAQKGNYYQALYKWENNSLVKLADTEVVNFERALERAAIYGTPVILLGECRKITQDKLPAWMKKAPDTLVMPKAASIALAALQGFDPEADKKIFGLEPYYIRRSEAEELWEKKQQALHSEK